MSLALRPLSSDVREALVSLLRSTPEFAPDEVEVALELADASLEQGPEQSGYFAEVALGAVEENPEELLGYLCYGPTPMTESTYDLYWIVTSRRARGAGVGVALHRHAERLMWARGARRLRIEVSSHKGIEATSRFYKGLGYKEVGRIADFYSPGDDLITYVLELSAP